MLIGNEIDNDIYYRIGIVDDKREYIKELKEELKIKNILRQIKEIYFSSLEETRTDNRLFGIIVSGIYISLLIAFIAATGYSLIGLKVIMLLLGAFLVGEASVEVNVFRHLGNFFKSISVELLLKNMMIRSKVKYLELSNEVIDRDEERIAGIIDSIKRKLSGLSEEQASLIEEELDYQLRQYRCDMSFAMRDVNIVAEQDLAVSRFMAILEGLEKQLEEEVSREGEKGTPRYAFTGIPKRVPDDEVRRFPYRRREL